MGDYFKNYDALSHAWAHQLQGEGYCSNSRMYFNGSTIYSYGSHFPIAEHYDNDIILFTTDIYSNTTAGHMSHVRSAIPYSSTVISVPNVIIPDKKKATNSAGLRSNLF